MKDRAIERETGRRGGEERGWCTVVIGGSEEYLENLRKLVWIFTLVAVRGKIVIIYAHADFCSLGKWIRVS